MATTSPSKRHLGLTSSTLISTSDVTVGGNLIVNGTTTTLNTATLQVEDKNIELNKGGSAASSNLGGITVLRGTSASAQFIWDQGNTRWDISNGLHVDGEIFTKSHGKSSQWATAYGWGNHADGGYAASGHNHDDDYLGKTAKAADSQKLDGLDSTKFLRDNGWNSHPGQDADLQIDQSVDFTYANNAPHSGPLIRIGADSYSLQLNATYNDDAGKLSFRSWNQDSAKKWNPWRTIYHSGVFTNNSANWDKAYGWGNHADAGYKTTDNDTLYNFAGTLFTSRNNTNPLKIDDAHSNMVGYTNTSSDAGYADGGLFVAAYSSSWVSQIFSNFRTGEISVRGKKSGTWQDWRFVHDSGHFSTTDVANGVTAYGWGNHADEGYVKSSGVETEADPIYKGERDDLRLNKMVHSTLLFDELEDFNKPSGYSTMIQPASHENPLPSHGYYHVLGRRDGEGGYGSLLQAYNSHELFHGNTTKNTTDINWYNVWTSGDFAKADVTEGATAYSWGDHANAGYIKTLPSHHHDDRYYTQTETADKFADIDTESHIDNAFIDIQVDGDSDTYYPVRIPGRGAYAYQRYSISRRYSWKAPDTWYTASHKGGLTFTFEWSGDTAWGGNHKAIRVVEFAESYSNMLGGIVLPVTGGVMVWLRGGGAHYRLHTPRGKHASVTIEYESYEAGNGEIYRPRNADEAKDGRTKEVNEKWPVRYSNDLYDDGNRVATQDWSNSQYLGKTAKAADSEKVDGINGASLLRSDAEDTFTGSLTMGTQKALVANNYGRGVYGLYDSYKYQHVWGMGKDYNLADDGSNTGNFYGIAYTHTNAGGESKSGLSHQALFMTGGKTRTAIGSGIWTSGTITTSSHGTSANWKTAYDWGDHGDAGYAASSHNHNDDYLGKTAKAADSETVDGIDSSRIVYGANSRRSTRADGEGIVSPSQNSGFHYGYRPDGAPFEEWWNWLTVAGASWTSGNNYDFKLAHNFHGDDFYVSRMTNGVQASWRKIVDESSASYNNGNWDTAHGWGNHADEGYLKTLPGHNHAGTHPLIDTATERGPDFDKLMPEANHTTYKEVHAINEGLNIPSGYTYGVVKSQYMGSMKYQEYVPHTASRGSSPTQDTIWFRTNWGGNSWYAWRYHIHSGNIGSQSVDNASKLDGIDSGSFLRSDANDSASGSYSFTNSYNEFGNSTSSVTNDGGWNARVNVAGSSHARLDVKSVSDGIITTMYAHVGHGAGKIGTMSSHPIQFMTGGTTRGQVNAKGVLHMAGDIVGYWSFSDRRLKTNVKPLENNLEKVLALHPVSYQWKEGERKGSTDIGLIAQEVEEIVPEVVREQERLEGDSTKTYKTVDYEHLVSVLIGAVKEQQEQINELKSKMCKCNGK